MVSVPDRKPNICIVTPSFHPDSPARGGGGSASALLLVKQLLARGYNVRVVAFGLYPWSTDHQFQEGTVTIRSVSRTPMIERFPHFAFFRLLKAVRREQRDIDVFHVYSPVLLPLFKLFRHFGIKSPVVATLNGYALISPDFTAMHGGKPTYNDSLATLFHSWKSLLFAYLRSPVTRACTYPGLFLLAALFRPAFTRGGRGLSSYIAISETIAALYRARRYEPIEVISNMVDLHATTLQKRVQRVIAYVGRLTPSKGISTLIEAFNHSGVDRTHGYSLWIIGDGPARSQLEGKTGNSQAIRFLGYQTGEALAKLYAAIDVFVHPGHRPEAFGRTILEAIQNNCRIVVSDLGAPKEIVKPYGLVYEHHDQFQLAELLRLMARDSGAGAVPQSVLSDYTPEVVVPRILDVYNRVVFGEA